ncbi:MAG: Flp family type IVb pilin [Pseudomonadota bacterium]
MPNLLSTCLHDERGATAIEYGLIAGLVAVVIIAGVTLLGADLAGIFQGLADAL